MEGIAEDGTIKEEARNAVMNELRMHFRPEFLNRLDETILFKPLTKEDMGQIVDLLLQEINARLSSQELTIALTQAAKEYVIQNGYEPIYGARPMKRYLQKHVETLAAKCILEGKVGRCDIITIDVENGALKVV